MTRKSEKIANLSFSILEPPSIKMTCNTPNFRLESFSSDIHDLNYLHLPPPNPKFEVKEENMCYTDIPMYAMAIATNKNSTPIRDCSVYGTLFFETRDIGRFSSTAIGLTDFTIQPNEQVFIPFQVKVPHLISSVSSRTKVIRSQSCFNTEIGSNQKPNNPPKTIMINSFFHFKANENNQKMQINIIEKINVQSSITLSYKTSNPVANSNRDSLFQIVLKNNLPMIIRNVEVKAIDPKPHSPLPAIQKPPSITNSEVDTQKIKKNNMVIKLSDLIDSNETVSGYISYLEPFKSIETYFLLPFCTFCCFSEPMLASYAISQKSQEDHSNHQYFSRNSASIIDAKKSPTSSPPKNISNSPSLKLLPVNSQKKIPKLPNLSFQANLNKLPKAVQTLRPFAVQIQIINTSKANDNNYISGSITIGESDSISLFGNNDLTFPNILPGQSHSIVVGLIALKQGNFPFPKITVRLNNSKNTDVNFETGVIAIGCNE